MARCFFVASVPQLTRNGVAVARQHTERRSMGCALACRSMKRNGNGGEMGDYIFRLFTGRVLSRCNILPLFSRNILLRYEIFHLRRGNIFRCENIFPLNNRRINRRKKITNGVELGRMSLLNSKKTLLNTKNCDGDTISRQLLRYDNKKNYAGYIHILWIYFLVLLQ